MSRLFLSQADSGRCSWCFLFFFLFSSSFVYAAPLPKLARQILVHSSGIDEELFIDLFLVATAPKQANLLRSSFGFPLRSRRRKQSIARVEPAAALSLP